MVSVEGAQRKNKNKKGAKNGKNYRDQSFACRENQSEFSVTKS